MDSWNLRKFKNDLSTFIELIKRHNVLGDFSILNNLLSDLDNQSNINYNVENIVFHINEPLGGKRTSPECIPCCKIYLDNKIYQKDILILENDPMHQFSLDINIHAYKRKRDANNLNKCYKSCWHLDQEYNTTASNKTIHPSYHFQFGGKKMVGVDTGMIAVLGAPRIPHPPMDIFLGFHFILSNFLDKTRFSFVNALMNDYDYEQIIKRAQKRLWRPYFNSYIPTNTHNDFVLAKTFPYYMQ